MRARLYYYGPVQIPSDSKQELLNLHQAVAARRCRLFAANRLLAAPEIKVRNLVHAGDSAKRSARLLRNVLAADILDGVLFQRLTGEAALLRAVVDQAVFADVQVPRSGAAFPLVGAPPGNVVLE